MENEIIINWVTYVKKEDNQKKQSKRSNGYWFIDTNGNILRERDEYDDKYKPFCYPTEAEAVKARDKQLALYRIKTYAEEKRGEFVPDWSNFNQEKCFIMYNCDYQKYYPNNSFGYKFGYKYLRPFCLAEIEHCEEIIEKFKDDLDILFDK